MAPDGGIVARASRIQVLSPELADQIAAGEVVERPASVVKELCENAVDAGARRVEIEIEVGGRKLIRVVDDGCGMTPDEARLALRRHATSKIRAADDLWGLPTFGFRGEALPSIAAVSRLTVATRIPEATAGFRLTVEAGAETDAREAGLPVGTQIEVRDLFFNTPARLKFLKAEATEVSARGNELTRDRTALAATLPAGLVARYEKVRARTGGIGAARLVGNHSEASGMPISPADLAQIEQAPADTLVYCPDSGPILVRATEG